MDKTVPLGRVKGTLTPPCSKSYAQRALAASLLCGETSVLRNLEFCDDTRSALRCIETLGARVKHVDASTLSIEGGLHPRGKVLHVGESGLATRLFTPIASLCGMPVTIEGQGTLLRRPMHMMIDPLRRLGVRVRDNDGYLPFEVRGPIRGGEIDVDGSVSSQFITGLLLALTLPATVPYWMAAVGAVFAVIVVKAAFGGLGQNIFNPALAARALLLLLFPASMTRFAAPGASVPLDLGSADVVTAATPLHSMVMPALPDVPLSEMFLGSIGGCIGEVSALALLIGGGYLVVRGVIKLRIPVSYLGTMAVLSFAFAPMEPLRWMLYSLLGGGVLLGALFMASDYATSPATPGGQVLYGIGCGVLTMLFRSVGLYPEGVTYAILLMNAASWLLERFTPTRLFGAPQRKGGLR